MPQPPSSAIVVLIYLFILTTNASNLLIGQSVRNADIIVRSYESNGGAPDYMFSYTKTYAGDNYRVITQLDIRDETAPEAGLRHAALVAGGPGYTYATITYTTGRYTRMKFNVTIYGKTPPFKVIP